jgi:hypothetical protein
MFPTKCLLRYFGQTGSGGSNEIIDNTSLQIAAVDHGQLIKTQS